MWGSFLIYHTMTSAFLCSLMTEKGELNVYRDRGVYNYLCNQCLSPLKLWVRTSFMARCTRYNFMWKSLSVTCDRSVVFSGYSGFPHQVNWPPRYITEILLKVVLNTISQPKLFIKVITLLSYISSCNSYSFAKM